MNTEYTNNVKEPTEWIIPNNPKDYKALSAFRKLKKLDWAQRNHILEGDIVYIYISGRIQAVSIKCKANKVNKEQSDIDDTEFF